MSKALGDGGKEELPFNRQKSKAIKSLTVKKHYHTLNLNMQSNYVARKPGFSVP